MKCQRLILLAFHTTQDLGILFKSLTAFDRKRPQHLTASGVQQAAIADGKHLQSRKIGTLAVALVRRKNARPKQR